MLVKRVTVARDADTAFCTACAKEIGTAQVLCYQRTLAAGEVVGIDHRKEHDMRLAAQAKGGFYPTPPRVTEMLVRSGLPRIGALPP